MTHCYLRIGSDTLGEAVPYYTIDGAKRAFMRDAEELASYGQEIDGTIHIASCRAELVEDADYHLSLGPRGGLRCERC